MEAKKWLEGGDKNSKYFHAIVKQRKVQSIIHKIKNADGHWLESDNEIGEEAVCFFKQLFTVDLLLPFFELL